MQVEVIRDLEQLASLREAWDQAVENSNFDSVFVTHEWFYCWAKNFVANQDIYVVIARDGDTLVGIMPLLIERHRRGMWTETILRSMSNLQTFKYNFIVRREDAESILIAMFDYINQNLAWTSMLLDFVPESAGNISLLTGIKGKSFYALQTDTHMESPFLQIEGSWEDYLKTRDKKVRKNWDYFERKLVKEGSTEIVSITDGAELDQYINSALEIEKSSWKGDQGTAIANSQAESGFYLDLGRSMSESGKFGLHFLSLNGNNIAFDYCLTYKDHFNVLKTGYNPAYSKSSPGRVLRKKLLRGLFEVGSYKTYDLLGARDSWKAEWTNEAQALLHVHIYNRRPIAIFNYSVAQSVRQVKTILRRYPGMYQAIKKIYKRLKG